MVDLILRLAVQHYDKVAKERLAREGKAPPAPGLHHLRIDSADGQAYLQVPRPLMTYTKIRRISISVNGLKFKQWWLTSSVLVVALGSAKQLLP